MPKKKFVRTDLSTPEVVHEAAMPTEAALIPLEVIPPKNTEVFFQVGPASTRTFRFESMYGVGVDQITYVCQRQIERFVDKQDGDVEPLTVFQYCFALAKFINYLSVVAATAKRELTLVDIDRSLIDGYLGFLKDEGNATQTQKNCYQGAKSVLKALGRRKIIQITRKGDHATFPQNPFPSAHKKNKAAKPLPLAQRKAFYTALRAEIAPLLLDGAELTRDLVGCAMLVVALHTGRNTTPLLEATVNCLQPHPKEDRFFLVLYKRRGQSVQQVVLKDLSAASENNSLSTVRLSVAGLIQRVIALSESMRKDAPERIRNLLWLYRSTTMGPTFGTPTVLTDGTLYCVIKRLVEKHGLKDSDGKPLNITISRLRKTFINRMYDILDGDLAATAKASGNSTQVVKVHYLRPGDEAEKNWKFMGEALASELMRNMLGATERTPVGRCSDAKNGDYAPKREDATCMSFLNCIRCRNYVVTGEDLHRLFSFYWRLLRERSRMNAKRWKRQLAHIVRLIERDVIEAGIKKRVFTVKAVDEARERARLTPHPFWSNDTIFGSLINP